MEYQDFFRLIIDGKLNDIKAAIAAGYDVNLPDQWGFLPLHRACANHQEGIARLLIAKGSALNAKATEDWTPLHLAVVSGALNCLAPLIEAGADANAEDKNGCNPLHLAVNYRNPELPTKCIEMLQVLITFGSNKHKANKKGETPLQYAQAKGRSDLFEILT